MRKPLVIAEKPSVATDLSHSLTKILGRFERKGKGRDTWFENDQAIITSAVGHLVELRMPTGPNGKKLPWNMTVLPAIPETFELDPIPDTESRLRQILKLAARKDVDLIVNACDAGREGELIFRYIMDLGRIHKPVRRLWMQSMTPQAIADAWRHLRSDEEMQPLADAARCRSESDWLVGLNATRALTCFRSRHGGFNITSAGRVQTPTLAILAAREAEIQAFKPEPYCEVRATFAVAAGSYQGTWIDERWKKDDTRPQSRPERITDPALAEAIRTRCLGRPGEVTEERKPHAQPTPQLYDLTTLQREAPFSAKNTLALAQALYERHKMVTYPRTDSRYLPEDYTATVRATLQQIAAGPHPAAPFATAILDGHDPDGPRLTKSRRIFDNRKVSDHFAIIPTGRFVKLNDSEQRLFDLVLRRFLAVFYPPALYEVTKRLTRIHHTPHPHPADTFKTDGRILTNPGWRAVYGAKPGTASGRDELVAVAPGEPATATEVVVAHEETKPPARFTEATLLSAMEGAGKLVDDEALAEAMAERGLGTPATRAAIIETLITQKYIARDGDGARAPLHATPNGMRLIDLLHEMDISALSSPSLTGEWEWKLRRMEHGELRRADFMREIESYTRDIVERTRRHLETVKGKPFPDIDAPCPACHAPTLRQTDATYECRQPGCPFRTNKHIAGRILAPDEARQLFATGQLGPLDGFRSKFNKPFSASLRLDPKFKVQFVFETDQQDEPPELGEEHLIGSATLADGRCLPVYQTDKAYHVPDLKTPSDPDGLRLGRTILQRELPADQALKLVSSGKSDLLPGFVSRRTKRTFSARLTLDPATGKLGFEFEERPPRRPAKKTAP